MLLTLPQGLLPALSSFGLPLQIRVIFSSAPSCWLERVVTYSLLDKILLSDCYVVDTVLATKGTEEKMGAI